MYKVIISSNGIEETIEKPSIRQIYKNLTEILPQINMNYSPHHLGTRSRLEKQYRLVNKGDWKYLVCDKILLKIYKL